MDVDQTLLQFLSENDDARAYVERLRAAQQHPDAAKAAAEGVAIDVHTVNTYILKSPPQAFSAIWSGARTYEILRGDRDYQIGDRLDLCEWQSPSPLQLRAEGFSGRHIFAEVVHKTPGGNWGLPIGACVLGLRVLAREEEVVAPDAAISGSFEEDEQVADVEIFSCKCGGHVRFSARGEPFEESLRYAMHTRPACAVFEEKVRDLFAEFVIEGMAS